MGRGNRLQGKFFIEPGRYVVAECGVLLGTGGLVRAYQGAVQAGLASSTIIDKKEGIQLTVGTDYTGLESCSI